MEKGSDILILDLATVKDFLRLEQDFYDEDPVLNLLISAAETYLYNATGIQFDSTNNIAKLFCLILVADWYDNRDYIGKVSDKVRYTIESMMTQLTYFYAGDSA